MKKSQTSTPQNERDQASQGGAKRGSQGGRSGGEASRSSSQQQQPAEQPKGSKQSVRPGGSSSQGLTGAQGSGGGAERGMQQAPDSLDRDD